MIKKKSKPKPELKKRWWHEPVSEILKTALAAAIAIFVKKKIK
jgi:hypothetical protein